VLADRRLSSSQQRALAAERANPIPGCIEHGTTSISREEIVPLYAALVQPHREYRGHFWAPPVKKDVQALERVPRRAPKLGQGLAGMSSEEQLRALGRSGLESRRPRGDLPALCSLLRRGRGEGGSELRSLVPSAGWERLNAASVRGGSDLT